MGGQCHTPATPPPKRLSTLVWDVECASGSVSWVWKISHPPGFDPQTVQPTAISYTDITLVHHSVQSNAKNDTQLFRWWRQADIALPMFNCLMPLPSAPEFRLPVSQSPAKIVIAAGGEIGEGQESGMNVAHCGAVCCWCWIVHMGFVIICAWCDSGDIIWQSVTAAVLTGSPLSLVRSIVSCNQMQSPPACEQPKKKYSRTPWKIKCFIKHHTI
jgi:hypothetical protein